MTSANRPNVSMPFGPIGGLVGAVTGYSHAQGIPLENVHENLTAILLIAPTCLEGLLGAAFGAGFGVNVMKKQGRVDKVSLELTARMAGYTGAISAAVGAAGTLIGYVVGYTAGHILK